MIWSVHEFKTEDRRGDYYAILSDDEAMPLILIGREPLPDAETKDLARAIATFLNRLEI